MVLNPEIFLDSLNIKAAQAQFSQATGAIYESDETCDLFESIVSDLQSAAIIAFEASVRATHVAPLKGVSAETLSNVF